MEQGERTKDEIRAKAAEMLGADDGPEWTPDPETGGSKRPFPMTEEQGEALQEFVTEIVNTKDYEGKAEDELLISTYTQAMMTGQTDLANNLEKAAKKASERIEEKGYVGQQITGTTQAVSKRLAEKGHTISTGNTKGLTVNIIDDVIEADKKKKKAESK